MQVIKQEKAIEDLTRSLRKTNQRLGVEIIADSDETSDSDDSDDS